MHATPLLRRMKTMALPLLGVAACCIAPATCAADLRDNRLDQLLITNTSLSGAYPKLDLAFVSSDLANGDDCDDDNNLLSQSAPSLDGELLALNTTRPRARNARETTASPPPAKNTTASPQPEAPPPAPTWEIVPSDRTLNAALARWAASAGWQLVWEVPVDYAVEAKTVVPGTFVEAVTTVTKSMATAEIPLKAIFYDGNKVLRIVAKGNE